MARLGRDTASLLEYEANSCDALVYGPGAHDEWAEAVDAVCGYIRDDKPETEISVQYAGADRLTPQLQLEVAQEHTVF